MSIYFNDLSRTSLGYLDMEESELEELEEKSDTSVRSDPLPFLRKIKKNVSPSLNISF